MTKEEILKRINPNIDCWIDYSAILQAMEEYASQSQKQQGNDAIEFAEFIGDEVLEFENGFWYEPNLVGDGTGTYKHVLKNPKTTQELYQIFKTQNHE